MWKMILSLNIKDWLIAITSFILIACISEIRKLKKSLALEIQKRLIPQLILEIDKETMKMHIKNESLYLAQNIKIEDTEVILDDCGFKTGVMLKFEGVDFLRANEKAELKFKAFDRQKNFLSDLTERIMPHLINAPFKVKVRLSNIENIKFCIILNKKQDKFSLEQIEFAS